MCSTNRRSSLQPWAPFLGHPRPVRHGRPSSSPLPALRQGGGDAMRDAQADVPWPEGFGRNLRSKTRWFTGFCNSHQVSHFATFFIDARAKISVAESRFVLQEWVPRTCADKPGTGRAHSCLYSLAQTAPGFVVFAEGSPKWSNPQR